jgi:hypothetical protein
MHQKKQYARRTNGVVMGVSRELYRPQPGPVLERRVKFCLTR